MLSYISISSLNSISGADILISIGCLDSSTIHEIRVSNFFEHSQSEVWWKSSEFPNSGIVGYRDTEITGTFLKSHLADAPLNVMCQWGMPVSRHHEKRFSQCLLQPMLLQCWVCPRFLCFKICVIELRVKFFWASLDHTVCCWHSLSLVIRVMSPISLSYLS